MSLIESIMSNFSQDTAYTKLAIHGIIEKHLKQSESKSIDDLIVEYKDLHGMGCGCDEYENIIREFISDLETLKQSEKVVEISKKELKEHCIGDECGIVYGAVCLLLLSKGIKLID